MKKKASKKILKKAAEKVGARISARTVKAKAKVAVKLVVSATVAVRGPGVGERVPGFALVDQSGKKVSLDDLLGGGPVVIYFYPKADSSGCTAETCEFDAGLAELKGLKGLKGAGGARVVGISPDKAGLVAKFATKHGVRFSLLSDEPSASGGKAGKATPLTISAYGVWGEKSMYGNVYMGVLRTTFVIDGAGVVVRRWDNVKVPGHAAEVLAFVRGLV